MWRSLRDRWAASPVRGQEQGHPVDSPGGCPPAAPTPAHRLPHRPHISTAGGLAAAIGATTLIFFQPLSGAAAPARFACQPPPLPNRDRRGSRPEWPGEPRRGAPGGSKGRPTAGQGGGTPPPLGGPAYPPLGGFWRGRGSRPKGGGTPSGGAPRSASSRRSYRYKEANFWRKPRILFIINGLRSIFGFSYVHPRVNIYVHPRSEHSARWRT